MVRVLTRSHIFLFPAIFPADAVNGRAGPGKVFLVGTGPGDPGLLTLRAVQLMQTADVVLYDRLVSDEILQLVHGGARMVYVGKQAGYHTRTQVGRKFSCCCGMCVAQVHARACSRCLVVPEATVSPAHTGHCPCAGFSSEQHIVKSATPQGSAHHQSLQMCAVLSAQRLCLYVLAAAARCHHC